MTETDLLYLEQLQEQRNIKLQLIPHALKLGNSYNVKDLIRDVDTLYRYVARVETDEPKKCTADEVYKQFGVKPYENTEYDRGDVDSISDKVETISTVFLPKSQDIELDCKDIKFVKCNDACECVDVCEGVTEKEEIKPWNTEEFKREFEELSATIVALATSGALKICGNNFDYALKQWPLFSQFHDRIMKCVPEKEREAHYDLLTKRIHQSTDAFKQEKTPWDKWEPIRYIDVNDAVNSNHTPINKEREIYKKQLKQITGLNKEYFSGESKLRAICEEHYASITNPKPSVSTKKSYFEEWDKERTLRLSQPQETNAQQLLLSI